MQFGYCVPVFANPGPGLFRTPNYDALNAAETLDLALCAERLGFDSLWVADHLMLGLNSEILEGWTTLSVLAGRTQRARLGLIHQAHPLRHPSLAAKMMATFDVLSNGRFIYFVDWGRSTDELARYGLIENEPPAVRVAKMLEGLELTMRMWQEDYPVTFEGRYYRVGRAIARPKPRQQPHPPIWLGETDPELLRWVSRYGQGWNLVFSGEERLQDALAQLTQHCRDVKRDVDTLERSIEVQILLAETEQDARDCLRGLLDKARRRAPLAPVWESYWRGETRRLPEEVEKTWLFGIPDQVNQRIAEWAHYGISHILLWFLDAPETRGIELFSETILRKPT
ncbi:MAG: LLM class flavin-dependent oxidoreductase [Firmicutes bacterium]|nr:LLM class flavin-dependent oxidoreductase [Bacillota bacterium]